MSASLTGHKKEWASHEDAQSARVSLVKGEVEYPPARRWLPILVSTFRGQI